MSIVKDLAIRALSYFAKPEEEIKKPRPDEGVWYSGISDQHSPDSHIRNLTPDKLGSAMVDAESGSTQSTYKIYEIAEQDPHVQTVWGKRRQAVVSKDLQITPAIEGDARAEKASELCNELVLGLNGYGGINDLDDILFNLTDAIGKGFSLCQIVWQENNGVFKPDKLIRWPQSECQLGNPLEKWQQDEDEVRVLTDDDRTSGIRIDDMPWQWICHRQKTWSVTLSKAALFRSIVWFYLFKHFSLKDWVIFIEKYGHPLRMGKYPLGSDDKERRNLWQSVLSLGKDNACILPIESTIEILESKMTSGGSRLPHHDLAVYCDNQISKVVLGNPMTTDPGDKGARALGEVYERGEGLITVRDCVNLSRTIKQGLLTPIVGFNMGFDTPVPNCKFLFEEQEDLSIDIDIDTKLVSSPISLPLSRKYFYEKYGRPEPEPSEDLVNDTNDDAVSDDLPFDDRIDDEDRIEDEEIIENTLRAFVRSLSAEKKRALSEAWVRSRLTSKEE